MEYIFKELRDDTYIQYPVEKLELIELPSSFLFSELFANYESLKFARAKIPKDLLALMGELLMKYDLTSKRGDFLALLTYFQYQYCSLLELFGGEVELLNDFVSESQDLDSMKKLFIKYLFETDKNKQPTNNHLNSITFSYKKGDSITIGNIFHVKDIYEAIISSYNIDRSNFEDSFKKNVVEHTSSLTRKQPEVLKKKIIKSIANYLESKSYSQSKSLRFAGAFLHLAQVKSNNREEFEIYDSIDEILKSIDIKNLRNACKRD